MRFPFRNALYRFQRTNKQNGVVISTERGIARGQIIQNQLYLWRKQAMTVNGKSEYIRDLLIFNIVEDDLLVTANSNSGSARVFSLDKTKSQAGYYYFDGQGYLDRTERVKEDALVWTLTQEGRDIIGHIHNDKGYEAASSFRYIKSIPSHSAELNYTCKQSSNISVRK